MNEATLKTPMGETKIAIPNPGDFKSFYLFAMHKSGSTLLNRMVNSALILAEIPQIAISEAAFEAGLPENNILNPEEIVFARGYCYRGFRVFPGYLRRFDLSGKKKVLLVRDPRDMVVSYYFSMAESHVIPQGGVIRDEMLARRAVVQRSQLEDFCMEYADYFKREFHSYHHIISSNIRIYRYEDIIFDKANWLRDMLAYFEVPMTAMDIERIAAENDIRPERERPSEHIRQVTPGNFRKHLAASAIKQLNAEFGVILTEYNYPE